MPGNITDAFKAVKADEITAMFSAVTEKLDDGGDETKAGRFRFVNYAGLSQIKPPRWLIEDFLPENAYAMLFGAPETFKTFVALDIALSIAVGPWMGNNVCWPGVNVQGSVLFAAGEGRSSISNRVKAWSNIYIKGREVPGFILGDPVPLVSEKLEPFIEGALKASPTDNYKLIILDTVGRAMQGLNENTQEHASAFTFMLEQIKYLTGATVLCLHHIGYTDSTRGRGSSVFPADADTLVRLDRKGDANFVSLTMTKQKDAEKWKRPKYIKLLEVPLGLEAKTLVAVKPPVEDTPTVKEEEKEAEKLDAFDRVEKAMLDHLKGNKELKFSDESLSEAICGNPYYLELGTAQTIKKSYIVIIKTNSERKVSRCWLKDASKRGYWRWQD